MAQLVVTEAMGFLDFAQLFDLVNRHSVGL